MPGTLPIQNAGVVLAVFPAHLSDVSTTSQLKALREMRGSDQSADAASVVNRPRLCEEAGRQAGREQSDGCRWRGESVGYHGSDSPVRGGHQSWSGTGRRGLRGRGTALNEKEGSVKSFL